MKCKRKIDAVDPSLWDDLMDASIARQMKFKERKPRDKSFREMTRLLRTTPSYRLALQELKSLPKRKK